MTNHAGERAVRVPAAQRQARCCSGRAVQQSGRAPRLRGLRSPLLRWPVYLRWCALAPHTMPVLILAVLWHFSLIVDPAFAPRFEGPMFAIGLIAGTCEDIGWTGFATPRLMQRWRPLAAGLLLGLIWALWHVLVSRRRVGQAPINCDGSREKPYPGVP